MNNLNPTKIQALALALAVIGAPYAFAVKPTGGNGGGSSTAVVTIDQDKAVNGGVTSGDAPGFPVTLNEPGSYRLDGNLTVPDTSTTAIEITSNDVTIDLNGFAILGPNICTSAGSCNVINGLGFGIQTTAEHTAVSGGTVRGMGGTGLVLGRNAHVERMHVTHNGGTGIAVGYDSLVSDCTADLNGRFGIAAYEGSLVLRNVLAYNSNGAYFSDEQGKVAIGLNVFRYNLINPWVRTPVQLLPSTCVGSNCF